MPWQEEDFGPFPDQDILKIHRHGQAVSIAKISTPEGVFAGFRHHWQDEQNRNWTTDICGCHTGQKFIVTVQLECDSAEIGRISQPPRKPYVVRQLLEELGGDLDGPFAVTADPICLSEGDIDLAARVLKGESDNFLPVIYVSSTWANQPPFDVAALSRWAAGMAHVVVEPTRRFSFLLAGRVARTNPYEGAIAICWPHGTGRRLHLYPCDFETSHKFASCVAEEVRKALAGRRCDNRCTWDFIVELVFNHRIAALRQEGKAGIDEYIREFDSELRATRQRLDSAEAEIARLKGELARTNAAYRGQEDGLLLFGSEEDLYSGEHRDVVVRALNIAKDQVQSDGRIRHVIESLLTANQPTGEMERLANAVRDAVDGCSNAGPRERRALEEIGFSITEEGKHFKLVFRGDDRYTFSMAKTGSDYRGMKNWVSDVCKRLFR